MTTTLHIRKAEFRDVPTLGMFNVRMAKETEHRDLDLETVTLGVKAIIKDPHKGFYLVAELKGEVVGQAMVTYEWSDWRNQYFLWLQSVYVPESHRGQGIFTALYLHLVDQARYRKDIAGLRLYVEHNNLLAQQTYERLGMYNPGYRMYEVLL